LPTLATVRPELCSEKATQNVAQNFAQNVAQKLSGIHHPLLKHLHIVIYFKEITEGLTEMVILSSFKITLR
jgi:hypothetical protein